jgi:putative endonuclease
MKNREIGITGESYAQNFLNSQNYKMITSNYRSRFGEVDIIAIDASSGELVFFEVKTRTSDLYGIPEASINHKKRQKLLKTALHFMNKSTKNIPISWRIDGIGIKLKSDRSLIEINHIKNILNG